MCNKLSGAAARTGNLRKKEESRILYMKFVRLGENQDEPILHENCSK